MGVSLLWACISYGRAFLIDVPLTDTHFISVHAMAVHVMACILILAPLWKEQKDVWDMLAGGTYRTEVSASFKLSGVYTASLVRLWWMIVFCDDFLDFRISALGLFVTVSQALN
jgi:hypothetical protein